MKTDNFYYQSPEKLQTELAKRKIAGGPNVLVQIFAGIVDKQHTLDMLQAIRKYLPNTPVVGATTAGEILDDNLSEQRNVISIAQFRTAKVRSCLMPEGDSIYQAGFQLAEKLLPQVVKEDETVFIVFGDGADIMRGTANALLQGIHASRPDIPIAGGRAGNAKGFDANFGRSTDLGETYIFTEDGIVELGVAGASISSPSLQVHRDVNLGWKTMGKRMQITRCKVDNQFTRIYEMEGMPPIEIYRKYFGDRIANEMPMAGMNFPFIARRDELEIAATPIQVFPDGSVIYTATLREGESIQFGFGEPGLILHESMRIAKTIADYPHPVEGIFIYSCATRRKILDHVAGNELKPFHNISPISGFLTGGEFYHTQSVNLAIGQTMTLLSLSEADSERSLERVSIPKAIEEKSIDSMLAMQTLVQRMTEELEEEQKQSENLLLNILPASIAERLKAGEHSIAERFEDASVLFADIVGFTELSSRNRPEDVVRVLNEIFSSFDRLVESYGLEKIKTIGDAYMVAGGIPLAIENHLERIANLALEMLAVILQLQQKNMDFLNIRIGLHQGPIVAGVLGSKKFAYDLWGDTVNIASRMESSGEAGRIQVTAAVREKLPRDFHFIERGEILIKGKGKMHTFFLEKSPS